MELLIKIVLVLGVIILGGYVLIYACVFVGLGIWGLIVVRNERKLRKLREANRRAE